MHGLPNPACVNAVTSALLGNVVELRSRQRNCIFQDVVLGPLLREVGFGGHWGLKALCISC